MCRGWAISNVTTRQSLLLKRHYNNLFLISVLYNPVTTCRRLFILSSYFNGTFFKGLNRNYPLLYYCNIMYCSFTQVRSTGGNHDTVNYIFM